MNQFIQEIIKPLLKEDEQITNVIGVYAGRFQPFGKHHLATYKWLSKQFKDSYIATSDKSGSAKHPLSFREKKKHMIKMGIPANKIVKEKSPYIANNILKKYDPKTTAVVYIFGQKDAGRLMSGKYFRDYKKEKSNLQGYPEQGYILVAPHVSVKVGGKELSGTAIRNMLGSTSMEDSKKRKLFKQLFGYYDDKAMELFTKRFVNESLMELGMTSGYPDQKELDDYMKKVDKNRSKTDSNKEYVFEPVNEGVDTDEVAGFMVYHLDKTGKKEYLLLRDSTYWGPPKGHLRKGETPLQGATRETYEETGITVSNTIKNFEFIYTVNFGTSKQKDITIYLGKTNSKNVELSHEHSEYVWVDRDQAISMMNQENAVDMFNSIESLDMNESISVPIEVGDTVLGGRFKNKPIVVKDIGKNEKGDITINGRPLLKYRIVSKSDIEEFVIKTNIIESSVTSNTAGGFVDDGPRYWYGNQNTYRKSAEREAAKLGYRVVNYIVPDMEFEEHDTYYPNGPTGAVTYFPAGLVGANAGTNILADLKGKPAFDKWLQNINRSIVRLGWNLVDFISADDSIKQSSKEPIKSTNPRVDQPDPTEPKDEKDQHNKMSVVEEQLFTKKWWKDILTEGGAYGHMAHPFDDMDLTFGDLRAIIENGLQGTLNREDNVTEKLDGQNLMISWKNGKLIAARNKGHLKNAGKTAPDVKGIQTMFKGRGDIENAFVFAMKDLQKAIGKLSEKQRTKIFQNGSSFMNLEVMWPKSANVVNYDKAEIVFHGALRYNDAGSPTGNVPDSARALEGMIRQVNQNVQKHYKISKPNFLKVPKSQNFGKRQSYYNSKVSKLQTKYSLKDADTLALYHQRYWETFIQQAEKKYSSRLNDMTFRGLVRRWAFGDKSFKIPDIKKALSDSPEFLNWALGFDKNDHAATIKSNMKPFEMLFFQLGAEILKNIKGFTAANPSASVQRMQKGLDKAIKDIQKGDDVKKIKLVKNQLEKLSAIGGPEAIVPSEGLVFKYKGKVYKFTGAFAPVNQILGALKFSR